MDKVRKLIKETLNEFISRKELGDVETYADGIFSDVGIDVEFTKHFLDRVNDPRNGTEITPEELMSLYKKAHDKYGNNLSHLKTGSERVVNDVQTDINVPVVLNKRGKEAEMVNMTVMRKKNFLTAPNSPKLKV
jgi:hypothetical protein